MKAVSQDLLAKTIRDNMKKTKGQIKERCKYLDNNQNNTFFNEISNDYRENFKETYNQKLLQQDMFKQILNHLDEILSNQRILTNYILEKSKKERGNVLRELNKLDDEINDIYIYVK
tara:strand:- start:182 stop:532 length:351 start_codon:yes stop_codon:yes gene_type:complete